MLYLIYIVSAFGSVRKQVLVLHTYVLREQNSFGGFISFLVPAGNSFWCFVHTQCTIQQELQFFQSWVPIWFFRLVFGWYFLVFTEPIPEENSVGTFRYYYFGGNPFFPQKEGHGPLFQGPSPHFEEKRVSRQTFKSSRQILQCSKYRPKYHTDRPAPVWYINTNTGKAASIKMVSNSRFEFNPYFGA